MLMMNDMHIDMCSLTRNQIIAKPFFMEIIVVLWHGAYVQSEITSSSIISFQEYGEEKKSSEKS
jgi:hypothetical protein